LDFDLLLSFDNLKHFNVRINKHKPMPTLNPISSVGLVIANNSKVVIASNPLLIRLLHKFKVGDYAEPSFGLVITKI